MSGTRSASRRPRAIVIVLAALAATLVLARGISAPFQKDAEPQSAEWMQSVARGHLLAPRDYYGYLTQKPLLFYWIGAALTELSGGAVDEVRARIVAVASAVALSVLILVWTIGNVGAIEGWLAFLFLLGTYGFASRAPLALTDMTLTLFMIAALAALYPILGGRAAGRERTRAIAIAIVMLFLGVLTKGPVAIVLPALTIFVYLLLQRRNPLALLTERWVWVVLLPLLAMSVAWYAIWFAFGDVQFRHTFMTENFGHFMPVGAGGTGEGARPPWFIVARLIGGSMPLVLLGPAAIAMLTNGELAREKRAPILYQACLALAVIVFFSVASAKRDDYILPALPGIAVLIASVFGAVDAARQIGKWLRSVAIVVIALAMLAAMLLVYVAAATNLLARLHLNSSDAALLQILVEGIKTPSAASIGFALAIASPAVAALITVRRQNIAASGVAVGILSLAASLLFTAIVRPQLAERRSLRSFVPQVHARVDDDPLCIVSGVNYELSFYYGAAVPNLQSGTCSDDNAARPAYLFAYASEYDALRRGLRARLKLVIQSNLIGGPGAPALYQVVPAKPAK